MGGNASKSPSAGRRPAPTGGGGGVGSNAAADGGGVGGGRAGAAAALQTATATPVDASAALPVVADARPVRGTDGGAVAPPVANSDAARRQQVLDDEALARRLMMEDTEAFAAEAARLGQNSSHLRGQQAQTAQAACPMCRTPNEFTAVGAGSVSLRCGCCGGLFQASLPTSGTSSSGVRAATGAAGPLGLTGAAPGHSLQMCRRCGTLNQFPTPAPGQPAPNVLCGLCGHVSQASRRTRRGLSRTAASEILLEQQRARGRLDGTSGGPLVRIAVNGQRRVVPLSLLLALMAEEADNGNPAHNSDIAALPTRKLAGNENLGSQNKCLICLDEFGDGDDVKTLPCLHIYHQKCVEQWLRTDNSCPVCKTPIGQA